jgi:FAD/FMN-containing dehydrogenase
VEGVSVMRGLKASLDPRGVLNPGKVFKMEGERERAKL